ncbi:MAG: DUF438 domain-containing protein [Olsenella sp.]|jgi:DUF438 domain-containing protein|nr:DUF438 domain-containing protein [Olsenella sp.]MCI1645892.1 DUF438 domain-containing protein [Olsenella sp.]MCI1794137.1 DUF438 domain-containing protein [Olsenella sp.]MCI1810730.1 DUF438 domain-containing protein [Olsenella sp.]MCI1879470.1 DUF438 domain-containing protein [Olsenella sp.]
MSKTLDLTKSVHDLAQEFPDFPQVMASIGFTDITKPAALNTVGRVMTVPKGCSIKGINLDGAIKAFEDAGFSVTGVGDETPCAEETPKAPQASAPLGTKIEGLDEAGRAKLLESYIARLSSGEPLEDVRADFVANFSDVDAGEIARAEQGLIEGGAKIGDVQRLCDVHSALFHGATREEKIANAEEAVMGSLTQGAGDLNTRFLTNLPGHPVHVFSLENQAISAQIARTRAALGTPAATDELRTLSQLGIHYAKKGDLLYPVLKVRHGYSGPADVMWGVDDEIRAELRALLGAREQDEAWRERAEKVLTRADEMVYKEANILLPLCAQNFSGDEWLQMYADLKGYDLCLIEDAGTWGAGEEYCQQRAAAAEKGAENHAASADEVALPTGRLTPAQLDAMLNTIPLEITFVDDNDINRYWNDDGEKKLFKRPSSALDREVWSCHPPKVQQMVRHVIATLKSGEQDSVDIWMEKEGEPVLVRYMAVRDRKGCYVGTMEVVQRMGFARDHFKA